MTLQELFKETNFENVKPFLLKLFDNNVDLSKFSKFYFYLSNIVPKESEWQIFIRKIKDNFDQKDYYHVSGIDGSLLIDASKKISLDTEILDVDSSLMTYCLSGEDRNSIVGMKIFQSEKLFNEISKEEVAALCLFDFSYFGITDNDIDLFFKEHS